MRRCLGPLACLALLGCLPEAARPVGSRLVEERNLGDVTLSPVPSTEVAFVRNATVTTGDFGVGRAEDLLVVPRTGGDARTLGHLVQVGFTSEWDAAGAFYVETAGPGGQRAPAAVLRFAPGGGAAEDLGP